MSSKNSYEASEVEGAVASPNLGAIRFKLSVMMFLQFFIWGAWLPPSFGFFDAGALAFTGWQQDLLNFSFPIAAILAMFFSNQFVDRKFAAERFLAASHLIGGLAILGFGALGYMSFTGTTPQRPPFWMFFVCMAVHCLFYVPTISVTNTLAFANLKDPQKDFGPVRLWGTIGWIAASWPFIFILTDWAKVPAMQKAGGFVSWLGTVLGTPLTGTALNQGISWAFIVAGIASLLLAAFSLSLPHTPPKRVVGENSLAWLEAMKLLKYPFIAVLFVVTFIDATVHDGFFFYAFSYLKHVGVPSNWVQPAMSVGQIAEIATMAFLGYVLKSIGWRYTMAIGVLGHALRFAVFALIVNPYLAVPANAVPYVAVAVNIVHGICYAFFFATLYIFVDEFFPKDARTSAQGLFNFLILGMGPIASRFVWRALRDEFTTADGQVVYSQLLLIPSAVAVVAGLLLLFFFHPPKKPVPESVGH